MGQRRRQIWVVDRFGHHVHPGVCRPERPENGRRQLRKPLVRYAHPEEAARVACRRPHLPNGALSQLQDFVGPDQQPPSSLGELDRATAAFEEDQAELALERTHVQADALLRQPETERRPAEMQVLRHGDEGPKVPKLHAHLPTPGEIGTAACRPDVPR